MTPFVGEEEEDEEAALEGAAGHARRQFPCASALQAAHPNTERVDGLSYSRWCGDLPFRLTAGNRMRAALRSGVPLLLRAEGPAAPELGDSEALDPDAAGAADAASRVFKAVFAEIMDFTSHVSLPEMALWRQNETSPLVAEVLLFPHAKYNDPELVRFRAEMGSALALAETRNGPGYASVRT